MSNEKNIILDFKVDERPILKKKVTNSFTIGAIRKINPMEDVGVAEIKFEDIPLLDKVVLTKIGTNSVRLTYIIELGQLISNQIDDNIFIEREIAFMHEIWKFDKEIMSILDSADLQITWGGPDSPKITSKAGVIYYFDDTIGFALVQRNTDLVNEIDSLTIKDLYEKADELSFIFSKVIAKTLVIE